ncbi:MAG TPA: DinB family protein [Sphingobacteriaceae bacterium]|nr:DinB family protein [Sphingobacteriaceae bacterium]
MKIHEQTLMRFGNQHKIIKHYIDDLPPEAIYKRLDPPRWSIHENIAYLCRYQQVFMDRIRLILDEVTPYFAMYKPDDDPEFRFTAAKTTGSILHCLYRVRDDLQIMVEDLNPEYFSRMGTHSRLGKMNIPQWIEFFLLHESNQLFKIFKLSGGFWSTENSDQQNIIYMPGMNNIIDDLAG